jgi:plastocyanin
MNAGFRGLAAVTLALSLAAVLACSKKDDKTTNPIPTLELNSGNIAASVGIYSHTFAAAGTYPYHCSIHPAMTGLVTVNQAGQLADSVEIQNMGPTGFNPANVTIGVGGIVKWKNKDTTTHTVTSD